MESNVSITDAVTIASTISVAGPAVYSADISIHGDLRFESDIAIYGGDFEFISADSSSHTGYLHGTCKINNAEISFSS